MQRFCNIAVAGRVEKRCCVYSTTHVQTCLAANQGCNKLREYWPLIGWNYAGVTPYTGYTSLCAKQVCLGPVKRATCTDFVAKGGTTVYFQQQLFLTCNNLICCETDLNADFKTCNIAFQLFCCNVAKQFAPFCRPFFIKTPQKSQWKVYLLKQSSVTTPPLPARCSNTLFIFSLNSDAMTFYSW